ncbi:MAG: tRNA (adenosine(37)-N6)-threonylcarbamoyltransferase complex dimerization subunit type 1 TsaB [Deltaproteobacteria bacterium]|nr:MAG: tRNA (adenosine(37)-N6)-threonylcarbamoyltransferase complex dimerization subunit type 1 TsaB [Deltaproteobacteria bacterium]
MIVLAVDTAAEFCNIAIMKNENPLCEMSFKNRGTHSKNIVQNIDYCCNLAGIKISEIDLFAGGVGPGNFTGVRIGVSTLKGLAYVLKKPLVGISSLDASALGFRHCEIPVLSVIDARRQEVYYSFYRFKNFVLDYKTEEKVGRPENISGISGLESIIITGNASFMYRDIFDSLFERIYYPPVWMNRINPLLMCELAVDKYTMDNKDETFGIVPNYIRRSNAEENLKK